MRINAALWLVACFLAIVAAEHVLVPGLGPVRHMVSEYANASEGWLMVCGFIIWAASLGLAADAARRDQTLPSRIAFAALLGVACLGMLLTASFPTQTIAGALPAGTHFTLRGRLHDWGSGTVSLALFAAALLSARLAALRRLAIAVTVFAVAADVGLLALGASVGGLRQRLLVVAGCLWQAAFLRVLQTRSADRAT